jgi:hypothetical protein
MAHFNVAGEQYQPGPMLRVIVQGVLPPILLTLWETFVVSFGMMYLVMAQNAHVSLSRTDQRFTKFYFLWQGVQWEQALEQRRISSSSSSSSFSSSSSVRQYEHSP